MVIMKRWLPLKGNRFSRFNCIWKEAIILGQNCIRLSDAALNDFFFENLFYQKLCNYAMSLGVDQIRGALLCLCRMLP